MCYAKPGPRCSAHAKRDLDRAVKARAEAHAAADDPALRASYYAAEDARRAEVKANGLPEGMTSYEANKAFYRAHPYGIAMQRSIAALDTLRDAESAYDATPAGIRELKDLMAAREEAVGADVLTDHKYQQAKRRIEIGQAVRRAQMDAYKQAHGGAPGNEEQAGGQRVDGDEAAAEAEALTPPPPCNCIEYKYQSECSHLNARVDRARKNILPTASEAALDAHAANSRARTLDAQWRQMQADLGLDHQRDWDTYAQARETNSALYDADVAAHEAIGDARSAEDRFYATPAGQALLQERIETGAACTGYGPHYMGGWENILTDVRNQRVDARNEFERLTGQPAPAEESAPTPPDLMYGNGCAAACNDFKWTGRCSHTDSEWGRTQQMIEAIRGMREVKSLNKAMDKAFGPKKGLLARLRGRS